MPRSVLRWPTTCVGLIQTCMTINCKTSVLLSQSNNPGNSPLYLFFENFSSSWRQPFKGLTWDVVPHECIQRVPGLYHVLFAVDWPSEMTWKVSTRSRPTRQKSSVMVNNMTVMTRARCRRTRSIRTTSCCCKRLVGDGPPLANNQRLIRCTRMEANREERLQRTAATWVAAAEPQSVNGRSIDRRWLMRLTDSNWTERCIWLRTPRPVTKLEPETFRAVFQRNDSLECTEQTALTDASYSRPRRFLLIYFGTESCKNQCKPA